MLFCFLFYVQFSHFLHHLNYAFLVNPASILSIFLKFDCSCSHVKVQLHLVFQVDGARVLRLLYQQLHLRNGHRPQNLPPQTAVSLLPPRQTDGECGSPQLVWFDAEACAKISPVHSNGSGTTLRSNNQ